MATLLHQSEPKSLDHDNSLQPHDPRFQTLLDELTREQISIQELQKSNNQLKLSAQSAIKERDEAINGHDLLKSEIDRLKDVQRPLLSEQLRYISKIHVQVYNVVRVINGEELVDESEVFSEDSLFGIGELDVEESLGESLIGIKSIYASVKVMMEKVIDAVKEKQCVGSLRVQDEVELGFETSGVLREEGQDDKFVVAKQGSGVIGEDEVVARDDSLQNSSKESWQEVSEFQQFVDELRAESSLLKAQVVAQDKELNQRKRHIEELEEKERLSNKNVERLMTNMSDPEKEITRWKRVAEAEAAGGRAVKQILVSQLSTLRQELDEAQEAIHDLEKSKESILSAAIATKDTGDKSLRLADLRNSILKERLEDLCRQLESVSQKDALNHKKQRYICWPWIWPGLNFIGYNQGETQEYNSNVEELSEPLL
ncbi:hypothetical protein ACHQM5_010970 [Ranunculus cassubicifolius]